MQDIVQCFCADILAHNTHLERRTGEMLAVVFTESSRSIVQLLNLSHASVMVSKSFQLIAAFQ